MISEQPFDLAVARYLEEMGMATAEQVSSALKLQLDLASKGTPVPLSEALVRAGILTPILRENIENIVRSRRSGPGQFSQYKLLDKLGEGGMGEVYLAEDTTANRKVAIKVLPRKYSDDPDFVARFRREAEAASKLRHVNVVGAYATGLELGYCFYVMEYCDGEPLDKRLRREGRLPWATAIKYVTEAARGLQYAHANGFIHRDVKPANIMVTREGSAKILDLGLSKNVAEKGGSFTTVTGAVMGTPHYIAPEQANADKVDARADIYSLGATLYHLVTGSTPFSGTTPVEILYKQIHAQLPNPQDLHEDLPDTLVHVIRKMMAKDPQDRYADCEGCILDLDEVMAGRTPSTNVLEPAKSAVALVRARPARKRTTLRRSEAPKSSRTAVIAVVIAALMIAIVAAVATRAPAPEEKPPPIARPAPRTAPTPAPDEPLRPADPAAPAATLEPWAGGIDLLPLIDPSKDTVAGAWARQPDGLRVDGSARARLEIPYIPSEQYDFRVVFTRLEGNDATCQFLTLTGQPFLWQMGAGGNTAFAFDRVQYQPLATNPTANRRTRCLETGRRYESVVQVRLNTATAFLDGRQIVRWTSNLKDLSRDPSWALRDEHLLGLGCSGTTTVFHSVEVREVFGRGRRTREAAAPGAESAPWRPLFDGRTTEGFDLFRGTWKLEGGALEGSADATGRLALQTLRVFDDVELRLRLEPLALGYLEFTLRGEGDRSTTVTYNRPELEAMGRVPTFLFRCRGPAVEASAEGRPRALATTSTADSGPLKIFANGSGLRLLSLEVRESGRENQGWRSLFDGRSTNCVSPKYQASWRVRDGALEPIATGPFTIATRQELPDGEMRVVLEARQLAYLHIDARQTNNGKTRAGVERAGINGLEHRRIELLLRCRGEDVSGTLDGRPLTFTVLGRTTSGAMRLGGEGDGLRVYSIEYRPFP